MYVTAGTFLELTALRVFWFSFPTLRMLLLLLLAAVAYPAIIESPSGPAHQLMNK